MPFELGLAVEAGHRQVHQWFVLDARPYRLQRSLSDLNSTDPPIDFAAAATRLAERLSRA
jgi:hypothetical protein